MHSTSDTEYYHSLVSLLQAVVSGMEYLESSRSDVQNTVITRLTYNPIDSSADARSSSPIDLMENWSQDHVKYTIVKHTNAEEISEVVSENIMPVVEFRRNSERRQEGDSRSAARLLQLELKYSILGSRSRASVAIFSSLRDYRDNMSN